MEHMFDNITGFDVFLIFVMLFLYYIGIPLILFLLGSYFLSKKKNKTAVIFYVLVVAYIIWVQLR